MLEVIYSTITYVNVYTVVLGLTFFLAIVYWRCKTEPEGIPPGPPYLPILGNMLDMRGDFLNYRHEYFAQLQQKYGNVFRIYFGSQLLIMLNDFTSIDEAFVKQKDIFTARPTEKLWGIKQSVKNSPGVVWSNGELWKSNRRLAIQSLRNLGVGKSGMEEKILTEADLMMETFPINEPFTIHQYLIRATTNVIGIVVFGKRWEYDDKDMARIMEVINQAFQSEGPLAPIHEFPSLRFLALIVGTKKFAGIREILSAIYAYIGEKIKTHETSFTPGKVRDFIDVVLTQIGQDPEVNKESLKRTVMDFFLAGSDTSANTLDWAILYMLQNPKILRKCQAEIDEVVGSNRRVEMCDRSNLPYVEATLMEVQRLGSVAPFPVPHTPIKDTTVAGYVIPKGSLVYGNIYNCHRDPKHWPNPLDFDPKRFLNEDGILEKKPPVGFMPFSTGPRSCPGDILAKMEILLFFTSIIQRFDVTKANPDDELRSDGPAGITRSPPSYTLRVVPRAERVC